MLPKGKRRQSVRAEYRAARTTEQEHEAAEREAEFAAHANPSLEPTDDEVPEPDEPLDDSAELDEDEESPPAPQLSSHDGIRALTADSSAAGTRLDAYLAHAIPDISRSRVQLLIEAGQVRVNGAPAKAKLKLRGGEHIEIEGEPRPEPLHATPEDIPLDILFEDAYLAIINKPAGMMVHAGAGASDDARSRGTLVNALLHHMGKLSQAGGELRPGIVHRLDKQTSGAIVVAKDDVTHRKLSELFSTRRVRKTYLALVHGNVAKDNVTLNLPIARDLVRRTRMTTRRAEGRTAVSHVRVLERLATPFGPFTLVEVRIETGRTHQIRVHMQSLGNPVVGDTLYGAPRTLVSPVTKAPSPHPTKERPPRLERNFLHAAHLEFSHPRTGKALSIDAPLPAELAEFLQRLRTLAVPVG